MERKWFVLPPPEEAPAARAAGTRAVPYVLQQPQVVELERVRGDCCGCCACFARTSSDPDRPSRSPPLYTSRCVAGVCALLLIVAGIVLFAVLVASLDVYASESGSGLV